MTEPTTAVVVRRRFSDDQLRAISSLTEALELAGPIVDISETELSSGFDVCSKTLLIDVPFVILDWSFSTGEQGEFVSVIIVTRDGKKYIITDGSTGIYAQLKRLPRLTSGVIGVAKGLRRSDYDRTDEQGQPIINDKTGKVERGSTFYLNTTSAHN